MNERNVKHLVKDMLTTYGAYWYMPVPGGYGAMGAPDFIICHKGRFIGVETKAPGKKASALQLLQKDKIIAAGGTWLLIDGTNMKDLEEVLK